MRAVIRLLRPVQWIKNGLVFAPLVFSKHLFDFSYIVQAMQACFAFCLVSGIVYTMNDIADRERDRLHPQKKLRPLAAGTLEVRDAYRVIVFLLAALFFCVLHLGTRFIIVIFLYAVINAAYSIFLKKVVLVDVFVIAAGFMLRVLAGVFAIDVEISSWLVLCTLFMSVFLAISKRRSELILNIDSHASTGRGVLEMYDIAFIDQIMTIAASGMAISYALYTVAERTVRVFGTENLIFTTIFVLFGIFRYIFLIRIRKTDDNPTHVLTSDAAMLVNIALWFAVCVVIIYFQEIKNLLLL
jgi:4-hydroxybenzoate polyprenyltransferase